MNLRWEADSPPIYALNLATDPVVRTVRPCLVDSKFPRRFGRQRNIYSGSSFSSMSDSVPACPVGPLDGIGLPPKSYGSASPPVSENLPACSVGPPGVVALPPFFGSSFASVSINLPACLVGPPDVIGLPSSPHPPSSDDANRGKSARSSQCSNTKARLPRSLDHEFPHAKCHNVRGNYEHLFFLFCGKQ